MAAKATSQKRARAYSAVIPSARCPISRPFLISSNGLGNCCHRSADFIVILAIKGVINSPQARPTFEVQSLRNALGLLAD
jgi:hypothetical protein